MGIEAYYEGRWDEALELYESCRELRRRTGDVTLVALVANNIAEILSDQGRLAEAEQVFAEARDVAEAANSALIALVARSNLGRAAARSGRFDEAEQLLEAALADLRELGSAMFVIEAEARLAELEALRGNSAQALLRAQAPLTSAREAGGLAPVEALLHRVIGMAHVQLGEPAAAKDAFDTSLEIARNADAPYEVALTLRERAPLTESDADATEAQEIFTRLGVEMGPLGFEPRTKGL